MELPAITILICARNAAAHISEALAGAKAQDYAGALSILVIDNGSTDSTAAVAEQYGARVVRHEIPGVVQARQRAWQEADTPLVAYLDSDCVPPSDWLSTVVPYLLAEERRAAVGVRLYAGRLSTLAETHIVQQGFMDTDRIWSRGIPFKGFLLTAALVLRRQAIEEVGGFDLSFGRDTGEDADLCFRLIEAGWRLDYVRQVAVRHNHRATLRAMVRQVYWYGQGQVALAARWHHRMAPGSRWSIHSYLRLGRAILCIPVALLREPDRYNKLSPILRVLDASAYLAGKWNSVIRHRFPHL